MLWVTTYSCINWHVYVLTTKNKKTHPQLLVIRLTIGVCLTLDRWNLLQLRADCKLIYLFTQNVGDGSFCFKQKEPSPLV